MVLDVFLNSGLGDLADAVADVETGDAAPETLSDPLADALDALLTAAPGGALLRAAIAEAVGGDAHDGGLLDWWCGPRSIEDAAVALLDGGAIDIWHECAARSI